MYKNNQHLKARLELIRQTLRALLDCRAPGRIRLISICAGDGRDVLEDMSKHGRRGDIEAWLIDSDAPSVARGQAAAAKLGLDRQVHFRRADAAVGQSYVDIAPADILVASGFLGRLPYRDIEHFVACLPALCTLGTEIIWSRHVRGNQGTDITKIRELFLGYNFAEKAFAIASPNGYAVGWHRFVGTPISLEPNLILFDSHHLKDQGAHLVSMSQESQDSPIGLLTFHRGRWITRYSRADSQADMQIQINSTGLGPMESEIAAVEQLLETLPEHIATMRRSTLMGWTYSPRRVSVNSNGGVAVRYRSRLRFLPSKTQLIVSPSAADR